MQKDLSHRISLRVSNHSASRNARNHAAFLALRGEIQKALDDGWTVYQIWETLNAEKKIIASYCTFNNQVKRLILKRKHRAPLPEEPASASPVPAPIARQPVKLDGFIFSSIPNKEDLL
ncbi:MAG: TraK family protein [Nitrosospira sp.]